ncbi:MAG: hypothetical protein P4L91_20840 [Burkholderiaceae bacterium]|nr:hypothetical protein [Burkholderiaceae bacterium]
MHNATVHYASRFQDSNTLRFLNALIETMQSFGTGVDRALYLDGSESGELQGSSTEVIAVGLCIGLTANLFDINKNQINPIYASGKRCDYRFEKNGLEYLVESKGRKHTGNLQAAVNDIFSKKANSTIGVPKYGVISHLPRDGNPCAMWVVDPEYVPAKVSLERRAMYLLAHYVSKARLAGFWRLADLLDERRVHLTRGGNLRDIDRQPLEYGSVMKLGTTAAFEFANGTQYQAFYSREQLAAFDGPDNAPKLVAGLERDAIEMLETQDFEKLMSGFLNRRDITDMRNSVSLNSDGSILMIPNRGMRR